MYYGTATELTTTLNPGEIVTTVNGAKGGEELALVNNRYQSFTVNKVYYNVWEHAFTGEEIPLEGTIIALYKKNADNTYEWVKNGKTDSLGQVTFEELTDEAGDEYVAVEVDIPQTAKDEYVYPQGNKEYLPDPMTNPEFQTLTEDQLGELLTFANAAAAIVTTKKGAIRSMPEREEVEVLLGK